MQNIQTSWQEPECKTVADSCACKTNTTSINITKSVFDKTWKRRGDCGSRPHRQRAPKIDSSKLVLSDKLGRLVLSHWPTSNYNISTELQLFNLTHSIIQQPRHAKIQVVTDCINEAIMTNVTNCSRVQSKLKQCVYVCEHHHHHHHWNFYSGLSSYATTRTTIVRVSTSSIRQCCNSSGISMSSNGAGRLTGTERRWHRLVSCSRP